MVLVAAWFPLAARPSAERLTYADYVGLGAIESGGADTREARDGAVKKFSAFLVQNGVPLAEINRWLAGPMLALSSASAPDRSRPVIAVAQGNEHGAYSQAVLCEYLASHGFVVVTTPSPVRTGSAVRAERDIFAVARRQADDLALAVRTITGRTSGLAVVGHSFGARAGYVLLADRRAATLVSLDGGIGFEAGNRWLEGSGLQPKDVRGSIIHIFADGDAAVRPDLTLLRETSAAAREVIRAPRLAHWQFTSFGTISAEYPEIAPGIAAAASAPTAADVVRYTGCRLDALRSRATGGQECDSSFPALQPQYRWAAIRP